MTCWQYLFFYYVCITRCITRVIQYEYEDH